MSKNTVKPGLRAKRAKRTTENSDFDAFARRILRAYGRRVADGDVEALRSLAQLSAELEAATRLAVAGLKNGPHAYSWAEIADRLGVSRQAVQMRYGDRADRNCLDRRLVRAGLAVTVDTLTTVFIDHHPGTPASSVCPGCGYRYPDGVTDCPTNATVRPLLFRRHGEDKNAFNRLTPDQSADLLSPKVARSNRAKARQAAQLMPTPAYDGPSLFDLCAGQEVAS
jgi:hypothetical protein